MNNKNEIIVTDFHNHSVKVSWRKNSVHIYNNPLLQLRWAKTWGALWLSFPGLQCRWRILVQIRLPRWRQWPVQRSHWCGRGRQWKHHCGWLGQQQNPGEIRDFQNYLYCFIKAQTTVYQWRVLMYTEPCPSRSLSSVLTPPILMALNKFTAYQHKGGRFSTT